jgi:hypothetical protein
MTVARLCCVDSLTSLPRGSHNYVQEDNFGAHIGFNQA